jgi:hypothetical protein
MRVFTSLIAIALALAVGLPTVNAAHIIVEDDFESYANTAAMDSVWGAANAGTLDTATGNPGQSMAHPGGVSGVQTFTATGASDADPITWSFDFLDDGAGNKRITGALRDVGGSAAGNQAFFEMGRFNSINNPETATTVSGYGIRHAFVAGSPAGASGWLTFVGNPTARVGWHTFTATIGATSATFDLDFDANGSVDATRTIAISAAAKLYNTVRFGGPSDVSSAGGGGHFDNLVISKGVHIPEPTTFALVGLGFVGACFASRRRVA